jgi:hypothetical protein
LPRKKSIPTGRPRGFFGSFGLLFFHYFRVNAMSGLRLVSAEFMYRPRPTDPRARRVFDFTLDSRLSELSRYENAVVLLIIDRSSTAESLDHLTATYPRLRFETALVNPKPLAPGQRDAYADTPTRCGWPDPANWQRCATTDRWARITFALEYAQKKDAPGWLVMPAHDAVWGAGLLARLMRFGEAHAANGLPAAVSPYSPLHHSAVPGADIPQEIIDGLNAAFARDSLLRWRLARGQYQSFWGKMGMIPFGMCGEILQRAETMVWEDDLEIDRVIREAGYAARALWVGNPALYRQALPLFDRAELKAVIDRTLHYSLNIPGDTSVLTRPPDVLARLRKAVSPRFAHAVALTDALTAECSAEIRARIDRCGQSWVDWGAYRYVVRVGDPVVQVWKYGQGMLY